MCFKIEDKFGLFPVLCFLVSFSNRLISLYVSQAKPDVIINTRQAPKFIDWKLRIWQSYQRQFDVNLIKQKRNKKGDDICCCFILKSRILRVHLQN